MFSMTARAKYDAWATVKGKSKEEAMKEYVAQLTKDDPEWKSDPCLAEFKA